METRVEACLTNVFGQTSGVVGKWAKKRWVVGLAWQAHSYTGVRQGLRNTATNRQNGILLLLLRRRDAKAIPKPRALYLAFPLVGRERVNFVR